MADLTDLAPLDPSLWHEVDEDAAVAGVFFLLGSLMFRDQGIIERVRPYWPWLLTGSVIMYVFVYRSFPQTINLQDAMAMQKGASPSWRHLMTSILEAYISLHMTLVCLIAGKALLNSASKSLRYIADSSYWIYIIHLPVLWGIQLLLLDTRWNLKR